MNTENLRRSLHHPSEQNGFRSSARTDADSAQGDLWKQRLALLSLLLIAFVAVWPYRNFAGDDAHISFRYARNLATGHGFAFNPDEPTYGSTSPLWVFAMAALYRLGFTVPAAAHLMNFLFIGLTMTAFWALCKPYLRRPALWWTASLLMAVDPWLIHWGMSGMENALALFLTVTALLYQQQWRNSGRMNWVSPLCCGLAILTRPEGVLFTLLLFLDTLLFERRTRAKNLMLGGVIVLAAAAPWLLYAKIHFGTIVPNTIKAKITSGHYGAFLRAVLYFASFWVFQGVGLLAVLALRGGTLWAGLRDPTARARWFLPVAWGLALPAFYVVGGAPVAGRYLMFALPVYLLIGVKAWEMLLNEDFARRKQPFAAGAAGLFALVLIAAYLLDAMDWFVFYFHLAMENYWPLIGGLAVCGALAASAALRRPVLMVGTFLAMTLVLVGAMQYRYCWYITRWPQGMDPNMIRMGEWLRDHSKPDDLIACDQIGVIGYYSDRYVLDLGALVSPEVQPYRKMEDPNALWRYLYERGAQYLVLFDTKPMLVERDPVYESVEFILQEKVQREGTGAAQGFGRYNLYRTHWPKKGLYQTASNRAGDSPTP